MVLVGIIRYLEIRLVDSEDNPVLGQTLADFQVYFTRNNLPGTDSLSLVETGSGRYVCQYTPSTTGHDYLELYHSVTNIRISKAEDIYSPAMIFGTGGVVIVTQNYITPRSLVPFIPNPQNYSLYVYLSSDWEQGRIDTAFSIASTELDSSGNWLTTEMSLLPNTYHFVLINNINGDTVIMAPFFSVVYSG